MLSVDLKSILCDLYLFFDNNEAEVKCVLGQLVVQLIAFQECLKEGTSEEIRFKAHRLKSELAIIGFKELSGQVDEIEASFFQGLQGQKDFDKFNQNTRTLLIVLNDFIQNT